MQNTPCQRVHQVAIPRALAHRHVATVRSDGLNRPKRTMAMHLMTDDEVDAYLQREIESRITDGR